MAESASRGHVLLASANSVVTTLMGSAATVLLGVVMARSLGPTGKGSVDLVVALAGLATLVLGVSVASGVTYHVARRVVRAAAMPVAGAVASIGLGVATFAVLTVFAGTFEAANILPPNGARFAALTGGLAATTFLQSVTRAALAGELRLIRANNIELAGRLVAIVLGLGVAWTSPEPGSFIWVLVLTGAGTGLAEWWAVGGARPTGSEVAAVVRYSVPSYAANVIQFLNYRMDLFLVALFRGPAEVGVYALAGSLVQLIWVIYRSGAAVLFPTLATRGRDQPLGPMSEAARLAFGFAILAAVGLAIMALLLLEPVYGPAFRGAVLPLLVLLPGAVALTPAGIVAAYFLARGRPDINAWISFGAFLITGVGDLILIPAWGIVGAALVSSLSYGATLVLTLIVVRRQAGTGPRDLLIPTIADIGRLIIAGRELLGRWRGTRWLA